MMGKAPLVLLLLATAAVLAACGSTPETINVAATQLAAGALTAAASPTGAPSNTSTARPVTPTATLSPGATPTGTPSRTQATATPTPTPTPTPGSACADRVLAFNPGPGAQAEYSDPQAMLGDPDLVEEPCCQGMVQLGRWGSVLLAFTDNSIVDGDGPDFQVYGESAGDDFLLVEVSADGQTWYAYPRAGESPGGLDLADADLSQAFYVRLTDLQPATSTGAEVDAVVALHSGPPLAGGLPALPEAVARQDLILYEGPNQRMKKVGAIPAGETLEVLGRSKVRGWAKVRAGDGSSGWCQVTGLALNVSLGDCEIAAAPPTPTVSPTPTSTPTRTPLPLKPITAPTYPRIPIPTGPPPQLPPPPNPPPIKPKP